MLCEHTNLLLEKNEIKFIILFNHCILFELHDSGAGVLKHIFFFNSSVNLKVFNYHYIDTCWKTLIEYFFL